MFRAQALTQVESFSGGHQQFEVGAGNSAGHCCLPSQEAGPSLCLMGSFWRIKVSPKGKMCVGFASYIIFTFEVALVHLPVFTESCVWDAFSIIKYFYLCLLSFDSKENHKANLQ